MMPSVVAISTNCAMECTTSANKTVTCLYSACLSNSATGDPQLWQNRAFSRCSAPQQVLKTPLSELSEDLAPTTAANEESQEPAATAPVRKQQPSTGSKADVADGSNAVKQPGTAKSAAEHVKAAVAKATGSKATDSKAGDSAE